VIHNSENNNNWKNNNSKRLIKSCVSYVLLMNTLMLTTITKQEIYIVDVLVDMKVIIFD